MIKDHSVNGQTDIWQFLAGIGFFLYGMYLVDSTIRNMEGRRLKIILKKNTSSKTGAVLSGLLVTAVLQSSSIVNLLLLSFSGAGVLALRSSLGVVLGANIGGTVNSWLVALLGFKVDLGSYALIFVAVSGCALFIIHENSRRRRLFVFCMGLGLILLGLDFAKTSMDGLLRAVDLSVFAGWPRFLLLLVGFVITAIVQTSAATVMIVLSALYAHAIPLDMAIVIVLGAELGTTLKIVIGSMRGAAIKRRIAAANVAMNVLTTGIGFLFLSPIVLALQFLGLQDPLFLLVAFQSAVNIIGALIFFFLLDVLSRFLGRFFSDDTRITTHFLQLASTDLPQPAIDMLEKEVRYFLLRVLAFNLRLFGLNGTRHCRKFLGEELHIEPRSMNDEIQYDNLKKSEDEMIRFYASLISKVQEQETGVRLNRIMVSARHAMYAAKALKDIEHNIRGLGNSASERDYAMYEHFREQMKSFMDAWLLIWHNGTKDPPATSLDRLLKDVEKNHHEDAANVYSHINDTPGSISTLLNVNREMYNAGKSLIAALRELLTENHIAQGAAVGK